jgi:hypothetical protein
VDTVFLLLIMGNLGKSVDFLSNKVKPVFKTLKENAIKKNSRGKHKWMHQREIGFSI